MLSQDETITFSIILYPYKKLEKEQIIDGVFVDSLIDIATNKLLTIITQRTEIKDFVSL